MHKLLAAVRRAAIDVDRAVSRTCLASDAGVTRLVGGNFRVWAAARACR